LRKTERTTIDHRQKHTHTYAADIAGEGAGTLTKEQWGMGADMTYTENRKRSRKGKGGRTR